MSQSWSRELAVSGGGPAWRLVSSVSGDLALGGRVLGVLHPGGLSHLQPPRPPALHTPGHGLQTEETGD